MNEKLFHVKRKQEFPHPAALPRLLATSALPLEEGIKTWACGTDLWKRPHSSEMGIWTGSVLNVSEMTELPEDKRKQPAYFWRLLFWPRGLPNNWHQTIGTVLITDDRNSMRKKTEPSNILSALQCHRCVTHQLWKCFLWAVISRKRTENI